jgi:hypothetical protein
MSAKDGLYLMDADEFNMGGWREIATLKEQHKNHL